MTALEKIATLLCLGRPMTAAEIAAHLGIPHGTVTSVLYSHREAFEKVDGTPGAAWRVMSGVNMDINQTTAPEPAEPAELIERDKTITGLRAQLSETRKLYRHALEADTLAQKVTESALAEIKAMAPVDNEPYRARIDLSDVTKTPQDVVALNSCLHFGEVVDSSATMGLGDYSPSLAAARWQYYVDTILDLVANHHRGDNIRKLYVVNVGDVVSGDIHLELKATNAFPLGAQMVRCAHLLAAGIRDLAASFEEVEFVGTVGNHGRFEKKPAFKEKANNADWVVYQMMAGLLADQPNVKVTIPGSPWSAFPIQGRNFFFTHGDNIKSYFQFPWYDAKRFTTEMAQLLVSGGEPYPEYWGFGHFHQMNMAQLSYGEWLFTGSFKGPDEYSIGKLRAGTPSNQLFFGVHPRRGVSFRYPIVMEAASTEVQGRYLKYGDPEWEVS
jgi:hypothetical protein